MKNMLFSRQACNLKNLSFIEAADDNDVEANDDEEEEDATDAGDCPSKMASW